MEGHTDNIGSDAGNLKLSDECANSVMIYLASKGVETSRLTAEGKGVTTPIADNKSQLGRAANRRVELVLQ